MTTNNDIEIKILNIDVIMGWGIETNSDICKICDGKLTLPPKNSDFVNNKIIKNDKIVIGQCEHAYHKSCFEEFGDCCFEDNLIFKKKKIVDTNLSSIIN